MGFARYPLLRYRLLAVTIALFAALWFALPVLKALAVPPDNGPIQGSATAVQDPSGSCPGRPNTIAFPATVQIQGGVLHITDPGGETSGTINADGTADLNGQGESYALLSSQGTTLNLREVNGGCSFLTTIVLERVLYQVPTEPPSTQVSETAAQPTASSTPGGVVVPETGGGRSLWWLWGTGIVVAVVLAGGGWWFYLYQPATSTDVAPDCSKHRERVRTAFEKVRPLLEAEDAVGVPRGELARSDDPYRELDYELWQLAMCLHEPVAPGSAGTEQYPDRAKRRSTLVRLGLLPEPEGFDPVPPTEGSGDEGDDRQEIG